MQKNTKLELKKGLNETQYYYYSMNFFSIIKLKKLLIKILNGKERNKNETTEKHTIYIIQVLEII